MQFARYTRSNLECIESASASGNRDAHQVTQLMLSLLGLIVFPWARDLPQSFESLPVECVSGGMNWQMKKGKRGTLKEFGRRLRNAVAHRRVEFSSDSGDFDQVHITFEDKPNNQPIDWIATINAGDLRIFCLDLIQLLENGSG